MGCEDNIYLNSVINSTIASYFFYLLADRITNKLYDDNHETTEIENLRYDYFQFLKKTKQTNHIS